MTGTSKGPSSTLQPAGEQGLRINLLGSLECWAGSRRIHLGGPVQERVMVALLLDAGQVMSVSQLVDFVWDEEPPATATHQVRKAVARLRQLIPSGGELILTEGPGYRVELPVEQLDLKVFLDLLEKAGRATSRQSWEEAASHLQAAVALRRGEVLAGSGGQAIRTAEVALRERYLDAVEQLTDLRLARGESRELVSELREHVAANPLRERLRSQLMLALYRCGRQAHALNEYQQLSRLLVEELGIDPGRELSALYERILRNDPALGAPGPVETPVAESAPHPVAKAVPRTALRSLPYDLTDFIGREPELSALQEILSEPAGQGPQVVAIDGMGGVGKTSLAVRFAYLAADHYPDGQLALDLCGYTAGGAPVSPAIAAEKLLGMLGVETDALPSEADARIALWRTMTTESRLLVLLDNVCDVAQVLPLLPQSGQALVLVTSRTRLIDLDGAHWMTLGTMTNEDGAAMAAQVLGGRRAAAEPEAVAELVALCGHLPLALRIALSRLGNRPRWPISYLVDRMSDESRLLDELKSGERGVDLSLRMSYEGLASRHRTAFRMLGVCPGRDVDVYSSAALLGMSALNAEAVLEVLLDAHMLKQHEIGCYTFHDLVRSFVRQLTHAESGDEVLAETRAAFARLLEYYVRATDHACDVLFPGRAVLRSTPIAEMFELPPMSTGEAARKWTYREQATLREALVLAHERGFDSQVARLARNVVFLLDADGLSEEFAEVARLAVISSRKVGDAELLRFSLSNLAVANWKLGRLAAGIEAVSEALAVAKAMDDRRGVAKDTGVLGLLVLTSGKHDEARTLLEEAIRIKRELGAGRAEAESLVNLGTLHEQRGDYAEAIAVGERALLLNRELGVQENEVVTLAYLAMTRLAMGDVAAADALLATARDLTLTAGVPGDIALVYVLSALVVHRQGRTAEARQFAALGLGLGHQKVRWTPLRTIVIDNLAARLHRAQAELAEAWTLHERALVLATRIGCRIEEARALIGLAEICDRRGETDQARSLERRANALFESLGVPQDARI
ncbi:BTAD domain-containing putative transcriptional regulator [Lentzea sp. NPDC092896]|uniref:AfsR/SARP family transcriptional regulator n=1 Tax=Lentzea sp. NPDC092896 TaxID=3364127 RepID=UPI00382CCAFE